MFLPLKKMYIVYHQDVGSWPVNWIDLNVLYGLLLRISQGSNLWWLEELKNGVPVDLVFKCK